MASKPDTEPHSRPDPHPDHHPRPVPHTVTIVVNNKPVALPSPETTGLAIKEAAIAQGVNIQVSFKLFVVRGHEQVPIANDERIKVREREQFRAVAPDDNS